VAGCAQEGLEAVRAEAEATRGLEAVAKVAPSSIESRWLQSRYTSEQALGRITQVCPIHPSHLTSLRQLSSSVLQQRFSKASVSLHGGGCALDVSGAYITQVELIKKDAMRLDRRVQFLSEKERIIEKMRRTGKRPEEDMQVRRSRA
jgi:hypothetical protein